MSLKKAATAAKYPSDRAVVCFYCKKSVKQSVRRSMLGISAQWPRAENKSISYLGEVTNSFCDKLENLGLKSIVL